MKMIIGLLPLYHAYCRGHYRIEAKFSKDALERAALFWGLGTYQFTPYKKQPAILAKLQLPKDCDERLIDNTARSDIFSA